MTRATLRLALLSLTLAAAAFARQGATPQGNAAKSPPPVEAVADARAPAGWKRYRFGSPALFTAVLPQAPALVPNQPPAGDGGLWSWGFYSASETAAYVLTYSLYAPGGELPKTEREKRIASNNFAAGFADGLLRSGRFGADARAEILGERRVSTGGVEAFERDFSLGEQHLGRLRTVFAGEHSLAASAIWLKGVQAAERAAFFDSLTFEMARGLSPHTAAGWKRYEPADRSFSVLLPADPSVEVRPDSGRTPGGTYYRVSDSDDGFYVIAHSPRALAGAGHLSAGELESFYEQIFKAVVESLKRDLKREGVEAELVPQPRRPATVGGLPGREQTFTLNGGTVEIRLQAAVAGGGFFTVLASWPLEVPLAVRKEVIDSFKINLPPPSPATRR